MRTAPWLPPVLRLGEGPFADTVEPVWVGVLDYEEHDTNMHIYYMVALGYALHALVYHVLWTKRRNDFWEMCIHHFAAIFLILFSYVGPYIRVGTLVLLVHDIPDIVSYLIKAVVDTKWTWLSVAVWGLLVTSWGFARLYVFPLYIIADCYTGGHQAIQGHPGLAPLYFFMVTLLSTLQVLHMWWYSMFIWMFASYVYSGKTVDTQQRTD
eukprot:UC1_evm1s150